MIQLSTVLQPCREIQGYGRYDKESKDHFFEIEYVDDKIIINLIHIYQYSDDNNRIRHKRVSKEVAEIKATMEEFCNIIIGIYESKLQIGLTGDVQTENLIKRIHVNKFNL